MASEAKPEKLTLWAAIKDLGWFPFLLMGLGGLSILAIIEQVVFREPLELVQIFQWPLDGYHRVMRLLGAMVEPLLQPAIDWLNARLNWSIALAPVWRPLFALGTVLVVSFARTIWREGMRGTAVGIALLGAFGALVGAVVAGLVPNEPVWWAQGLQAALPLVVVLLMMGPVTAVFEAARGDSAAAQRTLRGLLNVPAGIGLLLFFPAAGLSFVPGLAAGAGVVTLGAFVALMGARALTVGLTESANWRFAVFATRAGLTILGGFVTAGLILTADWGLKALGTG